ncbi:MAG TPA: hypothetical protein VK666_26760 [Chryseolinea sp.]|nr:hypothetical protein [Chryseolinea sp.]
MNIDRLKTEWSLYKLNAMQPISEAEIAYAMDSSTSMGGWSALRILTHCSMYALLLTFCQGC